MGMVILPACLYMQNDEDAMPMEAIRGPQIPLNWCYR